MNDIVTYNATSILNNLYREEFSNRRYDFLIENTDDILFLKSLVFFLSNDEISLDDFKKKMDKSLFICEINEREIYSISLKLLVELSGKKSENNVIVEFPSTIVREILLYKISNQHVVCKIRDNDELINVVSRYSIRFNTIKISEERKKSEICWNSKINLPFQKIIRENHQFFGANNKKIVVSNIVSIGLLKGFLFSANICYLNQIKLYIDDEIFIEYDIVDINNLCHFLTDDVIFLSLTSNSISENGETRLTDSMDFTNIRKPYLELYFTQSQENPVIFSVQKGLLEYDTERISIQTNPHIISNLSTV